MNQDASIFPVKYLNSYNTTNEDIIRIVYCFEQLKELLYRGKLDMERYIKTYTKFESELQELLKTNNMVVFTFVQNGQHMGINLFDLEYNFDGTPLEVLYGNKKSKILYVQKTKDYLETTLPEAIKKNMGVQK